MKIISTSCEILALLVFIILLIIYLLTLAPSVTEIDSGELAAVAYSWGIAHPTGYPLFSLLGHVWLKIPLPGEPLYRLNLLSAVLSALACSILYLTGLDISRSIQNKGSKQLGFQQRGYLVPLLSTLSLGLTPYVWRQATITEVYSLQFLLWSLFFNVLVKYYLKKINSLLVYLGLIVGLLFSNHMTAIFTFPLVLILIIFHKIPDFIRTTILFLVAFVGTVIFFYSLMWWRATQNPLMNWGDIANSDNFLRHISGWQYRVWMFSAKAIRENARVFFKEFPAQWGFIPLLSAIFGVIALWSYSRKFLLSLVFLFVTSVIYVSGYNIQDLEPYYTFPAILFFITLCFSQFVVIPGWRAAYPFILVSGIILQLAIHYKNQDRSKQRFIHQYAEMALGHLPHNAVVITFQWDVFVSPTLYLQHVEKVRPDVVVIDKELLRRSWYYSQTDRWHPGVWRGVKKEKEKFLHEVAAFENRDVFDPLRIQNAFTKLISSFIDSVSKYRTCYLGPELVHNDLGKDVILPVGTKVIPQTHFYQVIRDDQYHPPPWPEQEPDFGWRNEKFRNLIINLRKEMLFNCASYAAAHGDTILAKRFEQSYNLLHSYKTKSRK